MTQIWMVTNPGTRPAMICSAQENIGDTAVLKQIKDVLKRAKKEEISICSITVQIEDENAHVTLHGTYGGTYR